MTDVVALILHPAPAVGAGEIETWLADARAACAERHRSAFLAAGASDAVIETGPPDGRSFGARLRAFLERRRPGGLIVLGSGAIPLATAADRRGFVEVAASGARSVLANNAYSADVVAIGRAADLPIVPDLATDNELPRWLAATAGWTVHDLRRRWRLGVDIDGPLELALLGRSSWLAEPPPGILEVVAGRLTAIRAAVRDPAAELLVAGRLSAAGLAWLERSTASRTRALIEERGFRTRPPRQRPARSALGLLLDRAGPAQLGAIVAGLADAALVDSRVLLAHRLGTDEAAWPGAADRFASDLLLADRVVDPWLRSLTAAARDAPVPIVLGGHSLVGPGLRLALGGARGMGDDGGRPWT